MQRTVQRIVDEPITLFVTKADSDELNASATVSSTKSLEEFDGELKIHLLPQQRNKILIRLENIADLFDQSPQETPMFNIREYAEKLFKTNNPSAIIFDLKIIERTLSNNQDYHEWAKEKFIWPTESGPS